MKLFNQIMIIVVAISFLTSNALLAETKSSAKKNTKATSTKAKSAKKNQPVKSKNAKSTKNNKATTKTTSAQPATKPINLEQQPSQPKALTVTGNYSPILLISDLGDEAIDVSSIKGISYSVNKNLQVFDITNNVAHSNVWEASYLLYKAVGYWAQGAIFLTIVDAEVNSGTIPIVAKSKSGHYFITPNNGTLTMINEKIGIESIRVIEDTYQGLKNLENHSTFYGKDIYSYTAAKLAAKEITFEQIGKEIPIETLLTISYQKAFIRNGVINGIIPIIDRKNGNVLTNIPSALFSSLAPNIGDKFTVKIYNEDVITYIGAFTYQISPEAGNMDEDILYFNQNMDLTLGTNGGNFAQKNSIAFGPYWSVEISYYVEPQENIFEDSAMEPKILTEETLD